MTNKYIMKFKLTTLIDITDAHARKGDDIVKVNQQQNYLVALQTISLRSNPTIKKLTCETTDVHIGNYKGVHRVWHLIFEFEGYYDELHQLLLDDLNLVPVIVQLEETAKFELSAFITKGNNVNTTLEKID